MVAARGERDGGYGGSRDFTPRDLVGYERWVDGKRIVGSRNERMEKELYGELADLLKQHPIFQSK